MEAKSYSMKIHSRKCKSIGNENEGDVIAI
jgi:hypothetical protein